MEQVSPMFEGQNGSRITKWLTVVLIMLSLFLVVKAISGLKEYRYIGKGEANQNTITVTGKGEVVAIPDIVVLSFGVQEEAKTVKEAQDKATTKMNAAIDLLKKSGIADKDYKTTNYNIYPRYDYVERATVDGIYYPGGRQVLGAYVVSQSIEVKIRKTENAGTLLAGIGQLGLNNVSGLTFMNDKDEDLKKEAREKAIADARADAERLADDLGVSIVRIVNFSESGNYPMPYYSKTMALDGAANQAASAPELPGGENKFTSNVSITYEIR